MRNMDSKALYIEGLKVDNCHSDKRNMIASCPRGRCVNRIVTVVCICR